MIHYFSLSILVILTIIRQADAVLMAAIGAPRLMAPTKPTDSELSIVALPRLAHGINGMPLPSVV